MNLMLEWDGTKEDLIAFADCALGEESDGQLDSYDLGDAMGMIITQTMFNDSEILRKNAKGNTLHAWIDFDSFIWENIS